MPRSSPRLPLSTPEPGDDLANAAVALTVLHFFVLGHHDSWGSCADCQALADRVAPELPRRLRNNLRKGRADVLRPGERPQATTRWPASLIELVDPTLWPRLARVAGRVRWSIPFEPDTRPVDERPARRARTNANLPTLGYLTEGYVQAIEAAIDGGRGIVPTGDIAHLRHQTGPGSQHVSAGVGRRRTGRPARVVDDDLASELDAVAAEDTASLAEGDTPTGPCSACRQGALDVGRRLDSLAHVPLVEGGPPRGRAIVLAEKTMYRVSLKNFCFDAVQQARTAQKLPAKPGATLRPALRRPIAAIPGRQWPVATYVQLIVQVKYHLSDLTDGSDAGAFPYGAVVSTVFVTDQLPGGQEYLRPMTGHEAELALGEVVAAWARAGITADEIDEQLPFTRRLGGDHLTTTNDHGSAIDMTHEIADREGYGVVDDLLAAIINRLERSRAPRPAPDALLDAVALDVFLRRLSRGQRGRDAGIDDSAVAQTDEFKASVAARPEFRDLVDEVAFLWNGPPPAQEAALAA